ncbi:hypothetical protein VNO77_22376 [Canavalia gladiata]|uniref:Uncharacterized protein n=1 Tax=Canavalia gladiata TaxID=3824 RepID=A0AAN9L5Q8_CANGL
MGSGTHHIHIHLQNLKTRIDLSSWFRTELKSEKFREKINSLTRRKRPKEVRKLEKFVPSISSGTWIKEEMKITRKAKGEVFYYRLNLNEEEEEERNI